MINTENYSATFYNTPESRMAGKSAALSTAPVDQAALDFDRIINDLPTTNTAAPPTRTSDEDGLIVSAIKTVIDIVNPLQHIPVVSSIYRHMTGDVINPAAKLAGNVLYGGAVGGVVAVADIAFEKVTGKDAGETVIAALMTDEAAPTTQIATKLNDTIEPASTHTNANDIIWSRPIIAQNNTSNLTLVNDVNFAVPILAKTASNNSNINNSPASISPTPPTMTQGDELVWFPPPTSPTPSPVPLQKGDKNALMKSTVASTTPLHSETAPPPASRTNALAELSSLSHENIPKEQIAYQMMAALDQYQVMAMNGNRPSETYNY